MNRKNLHLDLKGIVPSSGQFRKWLDFFRECGFTRIFLEYDGRIEWDTFPGTARPAYTKEEMRSIQDYAAGIGIETAPLIQVHGHLDWLLIHEQYAYLRENNRVNELCPLHPDSVPLMCRWIDEVAAMNPGTRYIHLGADETWNLGSCPLCQAEAEKNGKMKLFTTYVAKLCSYAIQEGLQPLIWADMFWRENHFELAAELPAGTILVDWQYTGAGPFESTAKLRKSDIELWGASAIQCGWYEQWWRLMNHPDDRLQNILSWNENGMDIIHTTWGRPSSLTSLYPPWASLVPLFMAAGNPVRWQDHPWKTFIGRLAAVLYRDCPPELEKMQKETESLPVQNEIENQYRQWLILSLRYQVIAKLHQMESWGSRCLDVTATFVGRDQEFFRKNYTDLAIKLKNDFRELASDLEQFFHQYQLSDYAEFIAEKSAVLET